MHRSEFHFGDGLITFWELDVDEELPIEQQEDIFQEDLAQIEYQQGSLIIDVGWLPQGRPTGRFVVSIIKDRNWEVPILYLEVRDIASLKKSINKAIETVAALIASHSS